MQISRRVYSPIVLLLTFLSGAILPMQAAAQDGSFHVPPGFVLERVIQGLNTPTSFAIAPDGRIYVAQKDGRVRVFHDNDLLGEPFIDLRYEVNDAADRGLMGIALHPRFPTVPHMYLSYVYDPPEIRERNPTGARVSRLLRIDADQTDLDTHVPGSGLVLLGKNSSAEWVGNPDQGDYMPYTCLDQDGGHVQDCIPEEGTSHTLNFMAFAPDGSLYVSNGDGINNNPVNIRAQDPDSLAGKILRINPTTGQGYSSNPFFEGDLNSNRSKVYAMGVRNPFRLAINPSNGEIYVGDVGNERWEEINRVHAGANFGWPCFEGPEPAADYAGCRPLLDGERTVTHALYAYPHAEGMGSAIAGTFYNGRAYPANYRNAFFFADFNDGTIRYLQRQADGSMGDVIFARYVPGPVQISAGPDGDLYVLSIMSGTLSRIRYTDGANAAPIAIAAADVTSGQPPLEVAFSGSRSNDPDGDSITYLWDFGDGKSSAEAEPVHIFSQPGAYEVKLTATDARGAISQDRLEISVGDDAPSVTILAPDAGKRYAVGDTVRLSGAGVDPQDGELTATSLQWEAYLHHRNHVHYDHYRELGESGSFVYPDHDDHSYLELCLTGTDSSGLQDTECVDVRAQDVTLSFDTEPSGLALSYAGSRYPTPFEVTTQVNANRLIEAPRNPGNGYRFDSWSDDGDARHEITVGNQEQRFVATYSGEGLIPDAEVDAVAPPVAVQESASIELDSPESSVSMEESPVAEKADAIFDLLLAPSGSDRGAILREWWTGVGGSDLADLTGHADYPHRPTGSELLNRFEAPAPFADDYGTRIRGYVHPPLSGDYRFWIASDDNGQLLLSSDDNPANAVPIAGVPGWTGQRQWDKYPDQQSGTVYLEAGRRYYIEALQKEASFKDNLAVAWQFPDGERAVIAGVYLSPFAE